jgi:hypothetical protein
VIGGDHIADMSGHGGVPVLVYMLAVCFLCQIRGSFLPCVRITVRLFLSFS